MIYIHSTLRKDFQQSNAIGKNFLDEVGRRISIRVESKYRFKKLSEWHIKVGRKINNKKFNINHRSGKKEKHKCDTKIWVSPGSVFISVCPKPAPVYVRSISTFWMSTSKYFPWCCKAEEEYASAEILPMKTAGSPYLVYVRIIISSLNRSISN